MSELIKLGELIIDHTGEPRTLNYMMKQETFFMRRKWIEMEEENAAHVKRWAELGEWIDKLKTKAIKERRFHDASQIRDWQQELRK